MTDLRLTFLFSTIEHVIEFANSFIGRVSGYDRSYLFTGGSRSA